MTYGAGTARSRGGMARTVARVIHDPTLPLRVLARRVPFGSFELRSDLDLFPRPHYAYGVHQAAILASRLGLPAVSVIEVGVAGGAGLVELERIARLVSAEVGIRVDVYGFDRAVGLPQARDRRDLGYRWQDGFFEMDVDALRAKLTTAQLVLGDLSATVPEFGARDDVAPIGFVAIDVDYYTSTVDALGLFTGPTNTLLPRVWCYLDDIVGDDICVHAPYVGELAAVEEFNREQAERKVAPVHGLVHKRIRPAAWCEQMYALHCFDHDDYDTYVGPPAEHEQLRLRPARRPRQPEQR